jgi:hypothetical protein
MHPRLRPAAWTLFDILSRDKLNGGGGELDMDILSLRIRHGEYHAGVTAPVMLDDTSGAKYWCRDSFHYPKWADTGRCELNIFSYHLPRKRGTILYVPSNAVAAVDNAH